MTFGVRWGDGRFANRPYGGRGGEGFPVGGGQAWVRGDHEGTGEGVPGGEIPRGTRNDIWGALGGTGGSRTAPTGDGGRDGDGEGIGWVPACARKRTWGGRAPPSPVFTRAGSGRGRGIALRDIRNDMWGALGERAVREPPLRGKGGAGNGEGLKEGDGSPHARGHGEGEGWVAPPS